MATNNGGQYDNERRFTLFPNKRKVAGDRKPDYTGTITISGVDYWLSAWVQTPKQGGPRYMQGVIGDPKDATQQQARLPQPAQQTQQNAPRGAGANFQHGQQRQGNPPPQNPLQEEQAFKEDDIPF